MIITFAKSAFLVFLLQFLLVWHSANAAAPASTSKLSTQAEIDLKIQLIKQKENLAEEIRKRILATYAEIKDDLQEAENQEAKADGFRASLSNSPLTIKQMERQIADIENNLKNRKQDKLATFPTDELEQRLIIEKTRLSDLDAEIARQEGLAAEQLNRQPLIREKISEIKSKQVVIQQEQLNLNPQDAESLLEKEALQLRLEMRIRLLNSSLKTLELENISDPIRSQVQKAQLRLLNLQREQQSLLIADLENLLLDRRQQEIDKAQAELQQAEKAAEGKHPLILEATKENMRYNRSLQDITKKMEQFLGQKNDLEQHNKQLEKDFQSAEQKINLAGLSPALGNLLREQRRNLPQHKQFSELNDTIQNEIAQASLETFKLDEAKKNLSDVGTALMSRMAQLMPADADETERLRIRTELRMLLNDQKELVLRLSSVYGEYARILGDVDFSLQQMLGIADKYSAYLDQRLLWVPSAPVINKLYLRQTLDSLLWFSSPGNWSQVITNLWQGISNYPLILLIGLVIVAIHWHFRLMAKKRLLALLPVPEGMQQAHGFVHTIQALGCILLMSLSGPLLLSWLGAVLYLSGSSDFFSHAFATGLIKAAVSLCALQFFLRLFKPDGIAETLFHWQKRNIQLLFKQFKWMRFVVVPTIFITAMTGSDVFSEHSNTLGRMALILMMLAFTYVFHRVTHPVHGLGRQFQQHALGWYKWLPYAGYLVAVSLPLVIIGFAVDGYYQSALQLQEKLIYSLRLIFVTILFHELVQRWLVITRQQLALQNALNKRKQVNLTDKNALEGGFPVGDVVLDIGKIKQQSHKLLTTVILMILLLGCWLIWSDVLPAFSVFDRIVLWQHSELLEGKETLLPITMNDLIFSVAYAALAFVVISNFPALVDLLSAGKFKLSPGSRYALIQLTRYVLSSITFLAIANQLGGSWSQVQWLVAALSVGLGFGLQEIFANMVSGIILLFERPIRVGDTVTVGDVTGRVSRIQMRATHIVDWDRKELVVPNKIFITDRLINWTLSDTVTRIVVTLGVAYGSNIEQVESVLREAVQKTALVLQDPKPNILFDNFGDSSLVFNIHVFVQAMTDRVAVRHSLHKNIYEALQLQHIEIPFPQREVHIRSVAEGLFDFEQISQAKV